MSKHSNSDANADEPNAKRQHSCELTEAVQATLTPNQPVINIVMLFAKHGIWEVLSCMTEFQLQHAELMSLICTGYPAVFDYLHTAVKCGVIRFASENINATALLQYIAGKENEDPAVYIALFAISRPNIIRQAIIDNNCFTRPENIAGIISEIGDGVEFQLVVVFIVETFIRHAGHRSAWGNILKHYWSNINNVKDYFALRNHHYYVRALLLYYHHRCSKCGEAMVDQTSAINALRINEVPLGYTPTEYLFSSARDNELITYISRRSRDELHYMFNISCNIYARVWSRTLVASLLPELFDNHLNDVRLEQNLTIADFNHIDFTQKRILDICTHNSFLYHTMDDVMRQTPGLFERVLPLEFEHMPNDIKSNKQICMLMVSNPNSIDNYRYMPLAMQLDMDVFSQTMRRGCRLFMHSNDQVKSSPEHVMLALHKWPNNVNHIPFASNQTFIKKVLLSKPNGMTEYYFKVLTSKINLPNRRLIKIARMHGFKFNKTCKIPPRLIGMDDFIMTAEHRIYIVMHWLNRTYRSVDPNGYSIPNHPFGDIFRNQRLMEYLD